VRLDYLKGKSAARLADKKEMLSVVLFGASAFLGILILIKVTSFFVTSARAEDIVKEAVAQSKVNVKDMEKYFAGAVAIADGLKKNNLFAPPPPKQHPVNEVLGIMGNEVLISGNWYKVGDKIGEARIVAIEPAQVRIAWEGSEKVFAPISAAGVAEQKDVGKPIPENKSEVRKTTEPAAKPVTEKVVVTSDENPLAWMGVELPPKIKEKFLERWNKMSDEEKQKAKEEWNKMPDEQKRQAAEAMKQLPPEALE
jgi:hypothetical protein